MLTKNLENVLRVALEGPIDDCHKMINEVIGIWKNNTKFRYLFSHPYGIYVELLVPSKKVIICYDLL